MREVKRTQLGFADLELRQRVRWNPVLRQIGEFLDAQGALLNLVHRDLTRQLKHRRPGRVGMSAEQVLRSFVLMRLKNWDYRELAERIADGYTLRLFTRFDGAPCRATMPFSEASCSCRPTRCAGSTRGCSRWR